ncbi:serine/threonine-protein kinase [Marinobacterium aestuariivivens]|uniref:Serine/threonine-protein kinase n=1 Tax=Marinobacterium aestuariivivens TaxID=1698799 RepID=A0ABW1ZY63_9GAMM
MKIPGYQLKNEIGKGGMSTVYLAVQESLDREVALKIMAPALVADEDFRIRFLKEGKIVAKLIHPNIVTVYDIGAFESYYYMALEYASGGNLSQYIQKGLPKEHALLILRHIASALGYAHALGFIHRDVKSANILFRADKTPVLSDFGIAKAAASSGTQLTQAGLAIGTPKYMSPEQTMGKTVTAQSDFYSLGVVFHEMLTRRCPFEGEDSFVIAYKHINAPIPALPSDCAEFQPILDRLLAKSPDNRYSNTQELFSAIDEIRSGGASPLPSATATHVRTSAVSAGGVEGSAAIGLAPESESANAQNLEAEIPPQEKLIATAKSPPFDAVLSCSGIHPLDAVHTEAVWRRGLGNADRWWYLPVYNRRRRQGRDQRPHCGVTSHQEPNRLRQYPHGALAGRRRGVPTDITDRFG